MHRCVGVFFFIFFIDTSRVCLETVDKRSISVDKERNKKTNVVLGPRTLWWTSIVALSQILHEIWRKLPKFAARGDILPVQLIHCQTPVQPKYYIATTLAIQIKAGLWNVNVLPDATGAIKSCYGDKKRPTQATPSNTVNINLSLHSCYQHGPTNHLASKTSCPVAKATCDSRRSVIFFPEFAK